MKFGDKTKRYPYGYGFCQCGCGLRTMQIEREVYAKYRVGHDLRTLSRQVKNKKIKNTDVLTQAVKSPQTPDLQSQPKKTPVEYEALLKYDFSNSSFKRDSESYRLVEMYADLNIETQELRSFVALIESEIIFLIKYLRAFWQGDAHARDVIIDRLENILRHPRGGNESRSTCK